MNATVSVAGLVVLVLAAIWIGVAESQARSDYAWRAAAMQRRRLAEERRELDQERCRDCPFRRDRRPDG